MKGEGKFGWIVGARDCGQRRRWNLCRNGVAIVRASGRWRGNRWEEGERERWLGSSPEMEVEVELEKEVELEMEMMAMRRSGGGGGGGGLRTAASR